MPLTSLWLPLEASKIQHLECPNLVTLWPEARSSITCWSYSHTLPKFNSIFLEFITSLAQVSFSFFFFLFIFAALDFYWGLWCLSTSDRDYTCGFDFEVYNFTWGVVKFVSLNFLFLISTVSWRIQCQFSEYAYAWIVWLLLL